VTLLVNSSISKIPCVFLTKLCSFWHTWRNYFLKNQSMNTCGSNYRIFKLPSCKSTLESYGHLFDRIHKIITTKFSFWGVILQFMKSRYSSFFFASSTKFHFYIKLSPHGSNCTLWLINTNKLEFFKFCWQCQLELEFEVLGVSRKLVKYIVHSSKKNWNKNYFSLCRVSKQKTINFRSHGNLGVKRV
jgi:hypothetical protein